MPLTEPNIIDIVATDPQSGKLLLVMTEDRPWNGKPMFDQFMAKLGTYVSYALSEQFAQNHAGRKASDVVIKLDCAYEPDEPMRDCFRQAAARLQELGIGFAHEVCADDSE
ncbi:MAG: DUF6572 domain-containing protein [Gemmataceae bacterium]